VVDPRRDPTPASRAAAPALRPYEIRARLERFYALAAEADIPELTRLAGTVETWWPAVEAYLTMRVTNARTEGYNRKIKQIKRVRLSQPGFLRAPYPAQQRRDRGVTITRWSRPSRSTRRADNPEKGYPDHGSRCSFAGDPSARTLSPEERARLSAGRRHTSGRISPVPRATAVIRIPLLLNRGRGLPQAYRNCGAFPMIS